MPMPCLRLPSQPQSVTSHWLKLNNTAQWRDTEVMWTICPESLRSRTPTTKPYPDRESNARPLDRKFDIEPERQHDIVNCTCKAPSTPATKSKQQPTLSKQRSTFLPQTATMSNDSIVKFRPFDKVECCFDIVAVFGNNVAETGNIVDIVEKNRLTCSVRQCCLDIVAGVDGA